MTTLWSCRSDLIPYLHLLIVGALSMLPELLPVSRVGKVHQELWFLRSACPFVVHNSAKNLINAGLSRDRFFLRCELNFRSRLRKRSGVIDKYLSAEPSPTCPICAANAA